MKFLSLIAILATGCATSAPKPPTRTAYIEWHGVKIAYELPVNGMRK